LGYDETTLVSEDTPPVDANVQVERCGIRVPHADHSEPFRKVVLKALKEPVQTVLLCFCLYLGIFWLLQRRHTDSERTLELVARLAPAYTLWGETNMLLRQALRGQAKVSGQLHDLGQQVHELDFGSRGKSAAALSEHLLSAGADATAVHAQVRQALIGMESLLDQLSHAVAATAMTDN
jgi:hypothetical protein